MGSDFFALFFSFFSFFFPSYLSWSAVFSDARIENMFASFESLAKDGFVSKADFATVLSALFEDTKHEQVALLLETAYFMDRVFDFLDQGKKGKLSHEDFERVGLMFSSDSSELVAFRFFVYDAQSKGYITKGFVHERDWGRGEGVLFKIASFQKMT